MAHKTFISYKYSEAWSLRDRIIKALGDDASFYRGEDGYSDDMSSLKAETIKKKLRDMMFDTSVTIVVISPNMKQSKWISWEIEYSLSNTTRGDRTSHRNGVVGVIMKDWSCGYNWFVNHLTNVHGTPVVSYNDVLLPRIISVNHFNSKPPQWHCSICKTYNWLDGSYIEYVTEEDFLGNPQRYIDNAFNKSQNGAAGYEIIIP